MIRGRASKGKDSERLEVAIAGRRVPVLCTSLLSYSAYNALVGPCLIPSGYIRESGEFGNSVNLGTCSHVREGLTASWPSAHQRMAWVPAPGSLRLAASIVPSAPSVFCILYISGYFLLAHYG